MDLWAGKGKGRHKKAKGCSSTGAAQVGKLQSWIGWWSEMFLYEVL